MHRRPYSYRDGRGMALEELKLRRAVWMREEGEDGVVKPQTQWQILILKHPPGVLGVPICRPLPRVGCASL